MTDGKRCAITTLFFDVGGVLLTNGWDRHMRRAAAERFGLDWDDLQDRHEQVVSEFETGRLSLERYLRHTVFNRERSFSLDEFRSHMLAQSQPYDDSLRLARELAVGGKYLCGTINNESRDLNRYRIDRFELADVFDVFVSSCYVGVRKPDPGIYRLALEVTQRDPEECVFVDDRPLNLEAAGEAGLRTVHYVGANELRRSLADIGVI